MARSSLQSALCQALGGAPFSERLSWAVALVVFVANSQRAPRPLRRQPLATHSLAPRDVPQPDSNNHSDVDRGEWAPENGV